MQELFVLRLCVGISDEIEVTAIAIDETAVLEIEPWLRNDSIAIPIKADKVNRAITVKKSSRKCSAP